MSVATPFIEVESDATRAHRLAPLDETRES